MKSDKQFLFAFHPTMNSRKAQRWLFGHPTNPNICCHQFNRGTSICNCDLARISVWQNFAELKKRLAYNFDVDRTEAVAERNALSLRNERMSIKTGAIHSRSRVRSFQPSLRLLSAVHLKIPWPAPAYDTVISFGACNWQDIPNLIFELWDLMLSCHRSRKHTRRARH